MNARFLIFEPDIEFKFMPTAVIAHSQMITMEEVTMSTSINVLL